MRNLGLTMMLSTMFSLGGVAYAKPGAGNLDRLAESPLFGVRVQQRAVRAGNRGGIGFHAAERTKQTASAQLAAAGDTIDVTPRFTRNDGDILRGAGWTVELDATLRRSAWAGNALFVFTDVGDLKGNDDGGNTAIFQTNIPHADRLAASAVLALEDGFQPGHTYRMRVIQLIRGNEILLAEGQLQLE